MTTGNLPAYPIETEKTYYLGLSKRELFAKDFMAALLGNSAIYDRYDEYEIADMAVEYTDVFISHLNNEEQP